VDLVIVYIFNFRKFLIERYGKKANLVGYIFLIGIIRTFAILVYALATYALYIVRTDYFSALAR
jgi:hypothetical protein